VVSGMTADSPSQDGVRECARQWCVAYENAICRDLRIVLEGRGVVPARSSAEHAVVYNGGRLILPGASSKTLLAVIRVA